MKLGFQAVVKERAVRPWGWNYMASLALSSRTLSALICLLLAFGCQPADEVPEQELGSVAEPIVGGQIDVGTGAHEAVVMLLIAPQYSICTGTLVAENLVVTAWHCVAELLVSAIGCDVSGSSLNGDHVGADLPAGGIMVFTGASPDLSGPPDAVGSQIFHPAGHQLCARDLALVVLDAPLVVEPQRVRLAHGGAAGELVTAVGYGYTDDGASVGVRHRREGVEIVSAGPDWNYLQADGELSVSQSLCGGDSGGPVLALNSDAVIGVGSRGGGCGTSAHRVTELAPHAEMILSAFSAAGGTPILDSSDPSEVEPRRPTGAAGCMSGYQCSEAVCVQWREDSACSRFCDVAEPSCPAGTFCVEQPVRFDDQIQPVDVCVPAQSSCEVCAAERCAIELQRCAADEGCRSTLDCHSACDEDGCRASCPQDTSGRYQELLRCSCEADCGASCGCSPSEPPAGGSGGGDDNSDLSSSVEATGCLAGGHRGSAPPEVFIWLGGLIVLWRRSRIWTTSSLSRRRFLTTV